MSLSWPHVNITPIILTPLLNLNWGHRGKSLYHKICIPSSMKNKGITPVKSTWLPQKSTRFLNNINHALE